MEEERRREVATTAEKEKKSPKKSPRKEKKKIKVLIDVTVNNEATNEATKAAPSDVDNVEDNGKKKSKKKKKEEAIAAMFSPLRPPKKEKRKKVKIALPDGKKEKKEKKKDGGIKIKKTMDKDEEKKEKKEKKVKSEDDKKKRREKKKKQKGEKKKKSKSGDKKDKRKKKTNEIIVLETICCFCKDGDAHAEGYGNCEHVFCKPCLEYELNHPRADPQSEDNYLLAPTLGRCPSPGCSQELRMFEVKDIKTGEPLYEKNHEIPTDLKGLIFRPRDRKAPVGNFHFDEYEGKAVPFISFADAMVQDHEQWYLNDGDPVPERKMFEPGFHYDEATRTFHGTILWKNVRFQGAYRWDVVLAFRKDFSAIQVGLIHSHKEHRVKHIDDIKEDERHRYMYPCDGKWKLIWQNSEGNEKTGRVTVMGNQFSQGPFVFNLDFTDPKKAYFKWPLDAVFASVKSGVNLKKRPMGPKIGDLIVWQTTHPAFEEMAWVRETIGDPPIPSTTHFGTGEWFIEMVEKKKADAEDAEKDVEEDESVSSEESAVVEEEAHDSEAEESEDEESEKPEESETEASDDDASGSSEESSDDDSDASSELEVPSDSSFEMV